MEEGRELPVGWANAQVGELVEAGPKNDCHDDTQVGFVPLQRLGVDYLSRHSHEPRTWREVKKGYTHFQDGDVLLARITPSFENGKAGIARDLPNGIGAGSTEYIVCRPYSDALDPNYLLAHFKTRSFLLGGEMVMTGAVGQQRVPKSFVLESCLALAPLNEQRRIAAKLDTILAAVDACRQRLGDVEALLKRFRQAVLAAATSGELTREWREERGISDAWNRSQLGPLLNDMRYGTAKKCSYELVGLPVLRIPNILESGCICQADLKYAEFDSQDVARLSLVAGDLLVIRSNGSLDLVGRVAEASEKDAGMLFAGYLIRLRPDQEKLLSPYLLLALRSPSTRSTIELAARSTSGVNNINSQFLSSLAIPLPSIREQQEIVRRTQELFSLADQLEAKLTSTRRIVERLTPALLAKAFRGELVPQDPSDEPASVLLERIRAARQAESAASSPSRRGRHQAAANKETSSVAAAPVTPDRLASLLRECGALSEKALLAASELDPASFQAQLAYERSLGAIRNVHDEGQELLEAVG
jgi:type I restriction enzyme S subunit